jgi:hypothetical protein
MESSYQKSNLIQLRNNLIMPINKSKFISMKSKKEEMLLVVKLPMSNSKQIINLFRINKIEKIYK